MAAIDEAVTAKLGAEVGQDEALALWRELWATYQSGGPEAAGEFLDRQLQLPGEDEVRR
jgi:hypothetical protein